MTQPTNTVKALKEEPLVNTLVLGNLCEYRHKSYFAKLSPKATEFGRIMQNNGHYAV